MDYFERLESETLKLYEIANEARSKGFDVELETEIPLAKDLAERVEGLVGPKGIAKRIKELEKDMSREEVAFEIAAEIASQESKETGAETALGGPVRRQWCVCAISTKLIIFRQT